MSRRGGRPKHQPSQDLTFKSRGGYESFDPSQVSEVEIAGYVWTRQTYKGETVYARQGGPRAGLAMKLALEPDGQMRVTMVVMDQAP